MQQTLLWWTHLVNFNRKTVNPRQQRPWPKVIAAAEGMRVGLVNQYKAQQRLSKQLVESCGRQRLKMLHTLPLHAHGLTCYGLMS